MEIPVKPIVGGLLLVGAIWYWNQHQQRSAPKLEVSDFQCVRTGRDVLVSGAVKNISDKPLSLSATAALTLEADSLAVKMDLGKPRLINGTVTPKPLLPGRSGRFEIRGQLPSNVLPMGLGVDDRGRDLGGGWCQLRPFTDDSAGEHVNYGEPQGAR